MVVIAARRDAAGRQVAAQEIELIGQGTLLHGAGIDVHMVDGVFPQLPAHRLWRPLGGRRRRGDAVGGAGLHQQRAETRAANLIGRLNATSSAVRAHTSLRQLGPAIAV